MSSDDRINKEIESLQNRIDENSDGQLRIDLETFKKQFQANTHINGKKDENTKPDQ